MRRRASDGFGLLLLAALFLWGRKMTQPSGPAATRTDSTAPDVEAALLAAGAPMAAVKILAAHSAHETNGWKGGLWNWNLGNITTQGPTYVLQPGNGLHFAKYASLTDGAKAFVTLLRSPLYATAMPLATIGDLAGYVAALKKGGYAGNTDYLAYEAGLARWMSQLA
jgi:hypothetical protein